MENSRLKYTNLGDEIQEKSSFVGVSEEKKDEEVVVFQKKTKTDFFQEESSSQEDQKIFLLNNLLMSVQFFENYERDVQILREYWHNEIALEEHHKKCFYGDSLFRLVGNHVKFQSRHGINKDVEASLHPLRIFISDDNVEAAYDPAAFGQITSNITPFYQLTVKRCEENEKDKSGYVSLVEFKTFDGQNSSGNLLERDVPASRQTLDSGRMYESTGRNSTGIYLRRKSTFDLKNARKLTKTEKMIAFQNKNPTKLENRKSFARNLWVLDTEGTIPSGGFYDYVQPEARLKPKLVHEYRMQNIPETSHRIPRRCFQTVEVKKFNPRRRSGDSCFTIQNFLNSAALKAHFCDVLIEKLSAPLDLNINILYGGTIHEEVVTVDPVVQRCVTPIVKIKDWNKFVEINKKPRNNQKPKQLEWPTVQMRKIMSVLPCYAVPQGYLIHQKENVDFEKEWKLVFPKVEEFLLLHMMHAHLRSYFFILAIYKSFIEHEINSGSFGPKHLLHLFFWRVHTNFLAWPEDRLGETIVNFFKVAYKKIQSKCLCDFFITSRNLLAESHPKDLHKVQVIIKRILENPVPYVMRAIRNLKLEPTFYPTFDILKLNNILTTVETDNKVKKPRKQKTVRFEDDKERQWKRNAIKQIQIEKKLEEERLDRASADSINLEEVLPKHSENSPQSYKVLEIFICHFLEMGMKSTEYEALDTTLLYLYQTQKLLMLFPGGKEKLEVIKEKLNQLNEYCDKLKRKLLIKKGKGIQPQEAKKVQKTKINKEKKATPDSGAIEIIEPEEKESLSNDENSDTDEEYETKL